VIGSGGVVEITSDGVKKVPFSKAPKELQQALGGNVLQGVPAGAGH
jgi:hypothetical protein